MERSDSGGRTNTKSRDVRHEPYIVIIQERSSPKAVDE